MKLQNNDPKCPRGFGKSVPRFGKITCHPNLDPSGLYTIRDLGCDPCLYRPVPIHCTIPKAKVSPWQHKTSVEEWSKNLGYRNQSILKARQWFASIGGPAWCELSEPAPYQPVCKNVGFGRSHRFRPSKSQLPGPGTYFKPVPFKAPYGPHSTRPTLEREEPCRFKDDSRRWLLAPDRYTIIDKESIEMKSKKIVSKRGPYELFTGPRNMTTINNHFGQKLKVSAKTWPLALPGSLDQYKKSRLGAMNKTGRDKRYRGRNSLVDSAMAYHPPSDPGPAHYSLDKPKRFVKNRYGFNSSYDKGVGYRRTIVWPGVGRYTPHAVCCGLPGNGHKHVFLSRDERTMGAYLQKPMNSF